MVYCAKCGSENSDESSICENCGADLRSSQTARIVRSGPRGAGPSRVSPSLIFGVIIIIVGVTFFLGQNIGQIIGGWGENFGESMGNWGETFGESMGSWGDNIGRMFSEWGTGFGQILGALVLIIIGLFIVTRSLRKNQA